MERVNSDQITEAMVDAWMVKHGVAPTDFDAEAMRACAEALLIRGATPTGTARIARHVKRIERRIMELFT